MSARRSRDCRPARRQGGRYRRACFRRRSDYAISCRMDDWSAFGKLLIVLGGAVCLLGVLLVAIGKGWVPHLPGDLTFRLGSVRVFFPLATSIVLSIIITVVLNLIARR